MNSQPVIVIILLSFFAGCSSTKITEDIDNPARQAVETRAAMQSRVPADGSSEYEKITRDAETESGLFTVHQKSGKLYFEIPDEELGREMLLVTRIARAQAGMGFGGQPLNNQVIRWEKSGDRILMRRVIYTARADTSRSISIAVEAATFEPIIAAFEIQTLNDDSTASVIDVTRLFTTDVSELSPRQHYRARRVDVGRSYIESARTFPENVEVRNVLTMETSNNEAGQPGLGTISAKLHHSMVRLSDKPMMPRVHDERVGFFSVQHVDYGRDEHRAERRRYITRWRLEKKDPDAELSEPVKPIVFYVDRGTPKFLQEYIIKGIEDWQPAFEQAGFKNAIIAKMAPTPEEDPDWSPEDARFSNIRWVPSTVANARGPHVHDPRTGEIITSTIEMYHNVMSLLRNWYFVQASAVDEKARQLPFPDDLMGRLVRYVVAHEVGHTLGLQHNMKASGMVPTDSLRSPTFTRKYGTTPSIMDYARMNYVAQPGDDAYMFPIVSVYDKFAIEWGYKPVPDAKTPDEERPTLNRIASRQIENPFLRFGHLSTVDPTQQREALGDNHIKATRYGIANLKRVMEFLIEAAATEGENYSELNELYGHIINHRNRMLGHVAAWVGGVTGERKVFGQEGPVYQPVPRQRQYDAMQYLAEEAFRTPDYLINPQLLALIEPSGTVDRITGSQRMVLNTLLHENRLTRMFELEAVNGQDEIYTVGEMMKELTNAIWSELNSESVEIDLYRRNLQRTYIDIAEQKMTRNNVSGETRALMRGNLRKIASMIENGLSETGNSATRYHLEDVAHRIDQILNP